MDNNKDKKVHEVEFDKMPLKMQNATAGKNKENTVDARNPYRPKFI
jgi:hypothetical protein